MEYDAAALEAGQNLPQSWLELANQKQATQNSESARQATCRSRLAINQADLPYGQKGRLAISIFRYQCH